MNKRLSYFGVLVARGLFAIVPFWALYWISNGLSWLLQNVLRYRSKVIEQNLKRAFPEIDNTTLKERIRLAYRNLSDVSLETIKGYTMTESQIRARYHFENPELIHQLFDQDKRIIVTLGHTANWEWGGHGLGLHFTNRVLCVYQPIKNQYINRLIIKERSRFTMKMFAPRQTRALLKQLQQGPSMMVLVADQSPPSAASAKWVDFYGIETGFVPGPEFYAQKLKMPVVHTDIRRIRRGYYRIKFRQFYDGEELLPEGEITQRYARILEDQINRNPADWLWSHKRWKKQKPTTEKTSNS